MAAEEGLGDPEPENDSALMARFYANSEAAFEILADRWRPRLFRYFRTRGFGNEDAEDLVLETLLKLYSTRENKTFDTSQLLAPYLFRTARNVKVGAWRKLPESGTVLPWDEDLHLVTEEQASALITDLWECVDKLPEPERTYIKLCGRHGLGELSHTEIAAVLERWPPQVTQISKRAMSALKRCMTRKGYR